MDVGVYFDLRNPPGWRQDWSRLYGFTLEAIQDAEHLGADSVWLSEHHLFEDGYLTDAVRRVRELWNDPSHLPSPVQQPPRIWLNGPEGGAPGRSARRGAAVGGPQPVRALPGGSAGGWSRRGGGEDGRPLFTWVSEDPERDWAVVREHYAYQTNSYRSAVADSTGRAATPADVERHRAKGTSAKMGGFGCGTPEQVAAGTRGLLDGLPVSHIFIFASVAGMPEKMVKDHIATICGRLRPLLKNP
jgi:alkanesulfonate monooxygenase SsuD/methylene tetrahydromethanopterin reductase-like flavin-dependent oxidoreductase (luciferase family)